MIAAILGQLGDEDLTRLRMTQARIDSIEEKSSAYSREEIEAAYLKKYQIMGDVCKSLPIPAGMSFKVDVWTGYAMEDNDS